MEILDLHEVTAEIAGQKIYLLKGLYYKVELENMVLNSARLEGIEFDALIFEVEDVEPDVKIKANKIDSIRCLG